MIDSAETTAETTIDVAPKQHLLAELLIRLPRISETLAARAQTRYDALVREIPAEGTAAQRRAWQCEAWQIANMSKRERQRVVPSWTRQARPRYRRDGTARSRG